MNMDKFDKVFVDLNDAEKYCIFQVHQKSIYPLPISGKLFIEREDAQEYLDKQMKGVMNEIH